MNKTTTKVDETVTAVEPKPVKDPAVVEAEFLAARETDILKKYKNVNPGTIRRETEGHHTGKLTVEITCRRMKRDEDTGVQSECGNARRVATSDLFQVKVCEDCINEIRLGKRRRKAKQARIAKKKEGGEVVAKTVKAEKKTPKKAPKKLREVEGAEAPATELASV